MGSKLAAAKIAVWSGVEAVIADAARPGVLAAVTGSAPGVGTRFRPRERRLPARKLWIAFAIGASGTIVVDAGARRALVERGRSLLPAGVLSARGTFAVDDAVEIAGPDGAVFAKGLVRPGRRHGDQVGRPPVGRAARGRAPPRWSTATTWSCWTDPTRRRVPVTRRPASTLTRCDPAPPPP